MIMKVAAVVVTYNRKELLVENIEALLAQSCSEILDIIVVDNASSDGTATMMKKYDDNVQVKYVNTGANLGGAGGFQYGIRYVAEHGYDYVWIMDDDCIPTNTALEVLVNTDKQLNGNYGFLSSKVLWQDGTICKMNVQRKSIWKNVSEWNKTLVPIVMASFVSLFMPVKQVRKVGLPIKEFFIWTDDWEYTRRISMQKKSYLVNDSVVIHKSKNNFGASISDEQVDRLERYDYLYRNDVYLYKREGFAGVIYEILRLSFHIFKVLLQAKNMKLYRIRKIIMATIIGLSFNPRIEYPDCEIEVE